VTVRRATGADIEAAAATLAAAFEENVWTRWVMADMSRLEEMYRRYIELVAIPHGEVWVGTDDAGAVTPQEVAPGEGVAAVAVWVPDELGDAFPQGAEFFDERSDEAMAAIAPHAVTEPHLFLALVGVRPGLQGRGLGRAVLQPVLDRLDREGGVAALETSVPRNVELYSRLGFAIRAEVDLPAGAPRTWVMRRKPGEEPLPNALGRVWAVRVGDTVRRPRHVRSDGVAALLRQLRAAGFDEAASHLGVDEAGRDIFEWIDGEVIVEPADLGDAQLVSAARLIRRFHDTGAAAETAGAVEGDAVVAHGDLGPHNTVYRGDDAVGLIDWDEDSGPGSRLVDWAQGVWGFAGVAEDDLPVAEQARRIALLCEAYGSDPVEVVDEIAARWARARDAHRAAGREKAVEVFDGLIAWMDEHREALVSS
jgi:predicted N-acetyltransferase YhbS